jgi:hypothetical protein
MNYSARRSPPDVLLAIHDRPNRGDTECLIRLSLAPAHPTFSTNDRSNNNGDNGEHAQPGWNHDQQVDPVVHVLPF